MIEDNNDDFDWDPNEEPKVINEEDFIEPIEEASFVNNANVWHELGHVFANCLIKQLGHNLGNVILVNLCFEKSFMRTDIHYYFYPVNKGDYLNYKDCYDEDNFFLVNDHPNKGKIEVEVKADVVKSVACLVGLLSGGLFNIFPFQLEFNTIIFDQCYCYFPNPNITGGYRGCAGNDWDKIRRITCILDWKYEKLISFREKVSEIYLNNNVYDKMALIVNEVEPCVNKIEGGTLEDIISKIDKIISESPELKSDIQNLIETYSKK